MQVYHCCQNDGWPYSNSRIGPWVKLSKDLYPKGVRFEEKGRGDERGRDMRRRHDKHGKD
jgi:hypothetical protein